MGKKRGEKTNAGSSSKLGLLVGLGIVDVLCMALLVFSLLAGTTGSSEVQAETLGEFETNVEVYGNYDSEETYAAAAAVNYVSSTAPETTAAPTTAAPTTADPNNLYAGFLFPNSNTVLLTEADIAANANSQELCQRAINEIYARYGYQFTKQENLDFFNQYAWYVGMTKTSDMDAITRSFNDIEKANVQLLQNYEKSHNWN